MSLGERDVAEIFFVRKLLEPAAVTRARKVPDEVVQELRGYVTEMTRAARDRDWPAAVDRDMRFHRRLVSLLGSERIDGFFRTVTSELHLALMLVDRSVSHPYAVGQMERHERIVQLLEAGRRNECAEAILAHLDEAEAVVRESIAASLTQDAGG